MQYNKTIHEKLQTSPRQQMTVKQQHADQWMPDDRYILHTSNSTAHLNPGALKMLLTVLLPVAILCATTFIMRAN